VDDFRISDMKRLQEEDSLPPLSRQGRALNQIRVVPYEISLLRKDNY